MLTRVAGLTLVFLLCAPIYSRKAHDENSTGTIPYHLKWKKQFDLQCGLVPVGTTEEDGTLWMIAGKPVFEESLVKISFSGELLKAYPRPDPPTRLEWISYLSPAVSGGKVGLLASLASGGQNQTFEGALFFPVVPKRLLPPVRVSGRGPQFPTLVGTDSADFLAVGDQSPLTVIKIDSAGKVIWRESFSSKLVLPDVSVGLGGNAFVVAQGATYVLVQKVDVAGHVSASRRLSAKQATVIADSDGGCSLLYSKDWNGDRNRVQYVKLDNNLHKIREDVTPLIAWSGRTYEIVSSRHGYLIAGEGPPPPNFNPAKDTPRAVIAELDRSGRLMWQSPREALTPPLLLTFGNGFYVVSDGTHPEGMIVESYAY